MTAAEIRQSFLSFFQEKLHTIVPSASLLPQSPGLLFTNAGMNPFVPYFLGVEKAPYAPPRAADTQKCIRAGGKHNDLEDVGYDTYHHTFFEMLGNWSFGDYFKAEAIRWAWELVVERWGMPASRLYATVYAPKPGDPGVFDQEAWDIWAELFRAKGCDPTVHIVNGNVKDNFWMMGETGPCGPCSELHADLTPAGDTRGALVNASSDLCIEIWNLVFIQYNAEADGSFRELPAKHVDTGMGFERACSIIQGTKGFTDFSVKPSNYATDVFAPIFRKLEELSGQSYVNIYPEPGADRAGFSAEMKSAIAFRVIADHLRTLAFSIADGILPGNNGRNYVLRRILRRAVRYGRQLGFSGDKHFLAALVPVLVAEMGGVFPELQAREAAIRQTLDQEETAFNQTLDRGLKRFEEALAEMAGGAHASSVPGSGGSTRAPACVPAAPSPQGISEPTYSRRNLPHFERPWGKYMVTFSTRDRDILSEPERGVVMESILHARQTGQIHLYAACVMPDHVHLLIEPQIKSQEPDSNPVFFTLAEILQPIKSVTSHKILKDRRAATQNDHIRHLWEQENFDRLIRSESDLIEKYDYVIYNPVRDGLVSRAEDYRWTWCREFAEQAGSEGASGHTRGRVCSPKTLSGDIAFQLYDTFGFPIDLTELLCAERGLTVDMPRFEKLMARQREQAQAAQKAAVVRALDIATDAVTAFAGFDADECAATILEVHPQDDDLFVITDTTPFYAEMGGQTGDTGTMLLGEAAIPVTGVQQIGKARALVVPLAAANELPKPIRSGDRVLLRVDAARRRPVEAHHTATHLLHWALHEVVSADAAQQGSSVDEHRLRFDFNSAPLTPAQLAAME
jgi:alanyl-tRNA synthetase/REP element-mobilizing transposase RayT